MKAHANRCNLATGGIGLVRAHTRQQTCFRSWPCNVPVFIERTAESRKPYRTSLPARLLITERFALQNRQSLRRSH